MAQAQKTEEEVVPRKSLLTQEVVVTPPLEEVVPQRELTPLTTRQRGLTTQELAAQASQEALARQQQRQQRTERQEQVRRELREAVLGEPGPQERLAEVFQNWAYLSEGGYTAVEGLRVAAQATVPELRQVLEEVANRMEQGETMTLAFQRWEHRLSPLIVPIVRTHERHTSLHQAIVTLAKAFQQLAEQEQRVERSVLNPALVWPVLLGLTAIPVGYLVVFASLPFWIFSAWTLATMAGGVTLWRKRHALLKRQQQGPPTLKRAQRNLRSHRSGVVHRALATMRWNEAFALLWESGVPIAEALEASGEMAGNLHYKQALYRAAERTRQGLPLSETLAETSLLPRHLTNLVRTAEQTGDFSEVLVPFAKMQASDAAVEKGQRIVFGCVGLLFLPAALFCSYWLMRAFNAQVGIVALGAILALGWSIKRFALIGEPDRGMERVR